MGRWSSNGEAYKARLLDVDFAVAEERVMAWVAQTTHLTELAEDAVDSRPDITTEKTEWLE